MPHLSRFLLPIQDNIALPVLIHDAQHTENIAVSLPYPSSCQRSPVRKESLLDL